MRYAIVLWEGPDALPALDQLADPQTVRSHVPFAPRRIGEGGVWGELIVEEFAPQPPTEMETPAETHHQLNACFSSEWALRRWSGRSRSGIFSREDVAIIAAGEPVHWAWPYGSAHCVHVHLPERLLNMVADDIGAPRQRIAHIDSTLGCQNDLLQRLLWSLYCELRKTGPGSRLFVDTIAVQLCIAMIRRQPDVSDQDAKRAERLPTDIGRVVDYIEAHLGESISLGDLASLCDLTTHQLLRRFKRATGLPPHRFVMQRRAERAAETLRKDASETPLASLAAELGFADQTHFTKVFKQHVGMTPARYRALAKSYQNPIRLRQ
ncbi:MAG: AraC family transcriptional regulator [Ahrensia sp.]|nr:AraC family transcriptional regulator [Ahrensia sp.]